MRYLIFGGAGFVGSHTADALVAAGHDVRVFDNLDPQVHGRREGCPDYLDGRVEFIRGDVRDQAAVTAAMRGVDGLLYLAAAVGVGQSMYEVRRYVEVNTLGAANVLQVLCSRDHEIKRVVVASSMSVYGEGLYECEGCGPISPGFRKPAQLNRRHWELDCPRCKASLRPIPTPEDKPLHPASIYAITKRDQEEMFLTIGRAYGIPTLALRYFNIYGPRQALSNPYTGVAAIFSSRLLNGNPPLVFEDGDQTRDFIHVHDIVRANLLALDPSAPSYDVFNVGTGTATNVRKLAAMIRDHLGCEIEPIVTGRFREGDIRHCYADIGRICAVLGFEPRIPLQVGVEDLVEWVRMRNAQDGAEKAVQQLMQRGLVK